MLYSYDALCGTDDYEAKTFVIVSYNTPRGAQLSIDWENIGVA